MYPEVAPLPADPFYVALYLNDLVLDDCKKGTLDTAALGIRYGHVNAGLGSPLENNFVRAILEGAKRMVGKSGSHRQKEPLTSEMVREIRFLGISAHKRVTGNSGRRYSFRHGMCKNNHPQVKE